MPCVYHFKLYDYAVYCTVTICSLTFLVNFDAILQWYGQVSKRSYFASANNVLMTTITKLKPEVVFLYVFRSFLQHHK